MAKSKKENLKGMKSEDLKKNLATLTESLRTMRFKSEGSRQKNVKEYGTTRRQIARVLTAMNAQK